MAYLANMANLSSSLDESNEGIVVTVTGFNDSLPQYTISLFQRLADF